MIKFIALALILTPVAFGGDLPSGAALVCQTEVSREDCRWIAEQAIDEVEGNRTVVRAVVKDVPATDVAIFDVHFRFNDGTVDVVRKTIEIDTE